MPQYYSVSELDNFDNYLVSQERFFKVDLMMMQNCVPNFNSSMFHIYFEKDYLRIHRLEYCLDNILYWISLILTVEI